MKKKTAAPVAPAAPEAPKKMIVEQTLLLKMLRADAERRAAGNAHVLAQQQKAMLLKQLDPQGLIAQAEEIIRTTATQVTDYDQKTRAFVDEIQKQFGIDIADYSIDDETGVLTPIPKER